ncbi:hypothetical protein CEE37_13855 [candidate division LCP-89 bacterium B3_LCP]|uniref:Uncharacterized protein n=1 Tax=candidate division LCP-89 bacterium B3_LCP TaxID=2012998 RepID=A0A532URN7_UNCL8|nr:MAG: hypothetical protein CEE37_13855 [candidate division LCP-89 bacterium B3_LCP]
MLFMKSPGDFSRKSTFPLLTKTGFTAVILMLIGLKKLCLSSGIRGSPDYRIVFVVPACPESDKHIDWSLTLDIIVEYKCCENMMQEENGSFKGKTIEQKFSQRGRKS